MSCPLKNLVFTKNHPNKNLSQTYLAMLKYLNHCIMNIALMPNIVKLSSEYQTLH